MKIGIAQRRLMEYSGMQGCEFRIAHKSVLKRYSFTADFWGLSAAIGRSEVYG